MFYSKILPDLASDSIWIPTRRTTNSEYFQKNKCILHVGNNRDFLKQRPGALTTPHFSFGKDYQ